MILSEKGNIFLSPLIGANIKKADFIGAITKLSATLGYRLQKYNNQKINRKDILVIWNRHLNQDSIAKLFEDKGCLVLCFENPYFDMNGYFSVGKGYYNSINHIPKGNSDRFNSFGIKIHPWKKDGDTILVASQNKLWNEPALGLTNHTQPSGWDSSVLKILVKNTDKKILFRCHPKVKNPLSYTNNIKEISDKIEFSNGDKPLRYDLNSCYSVITHSSNSATVALLYGIPVFTTCPFGPITKSMCKLGTHIVDPYYPDNREQVFSDIAWGVYSLDEISNGFMVDKFKGME